MKYAADLASCIWKALGFVLRLTHTDCAKFISLDTEKPARRGFQHERPPSPPHTGETLGGGLGPRPPGPDAYELLKAPSHRLVRSQYCGIVWVKEEGSWRDLEICAKPKVGGGRRDLLPPPPPWKVGDEHPPFPPCSYAYELPGRDLYELCTLPLNCLLKSAICRELKNGKNQTDQFQKWWNRPLWAYIHVQVCQVHMGTGPCTAFCLPPAGKIQTRQAPHSCGLSIFIAQKQCQCVHGTTRWETTRFCRSRDTLLESWQRFISLCMEQSGVSKVCVTLSCFCVFRDLIFALDTVKGRVIIVDWCQMKFVPSWTSSSSPEPRVQGRARSTELPVKTRIESSCRQLFIQGCQLQCKTVACVTKFSRRIKSEGLYIWLSFFFNITVTFSFHVSPCQYSDSLL